MNLIGRLTDSIGQKQEKALKGLEEGSFFKRPKNFFEFMDGLKEEFMENFEDQIEKHAANMKNYLFEDNNLNLDIAKLAGKVTGVQEENFIKVSIDIESMMKSGVTLPIDTTQTVERKVRREDVAKQVQPQVQAKPKTLKAAITPQRQEPRPLIDPNYHPKPSYSAKIEPGTSIDHNLGEQFIGKLTRAIAQKQSKTNENNMRSIPNFFKAKMDFSQFWSTLKEQFSSHLEISMLEHVQNIGAYLSKVESLPVPLVSKQITKKHIFAMNNLENNFNESFKGYTLTIYNLEQFTVQRPIRREETISVQLKTKSADKPRRKLVEHNSSESKRQESLIPSQPNFTQSATITHQNEILAASNPANILVVREEPRIAANSHVIIKRDIVKELQERRKKMLEKQTKAKQIRTRLIKMDAILGNQQKIAKQKEAKQKINAAVEFVKNLSEKKKSTSFKITEWRQDTIKKHLDNYRHVENTPNKYGRHRRQIDNLREMYEQDSQMMYGGGSMTKRASSKKGEKNFILRKPMPYNLYNVNQKEKEREVFTLEK